MNDYTFTDGPFQGRTARIAREAALYRNLSDPWGVSGPTAEYRINHDTRTLQHIRTYTQDAA